MVLVDIFRELWEFWKCRAWYIEVICKLWFVLNQLYVFCSTRNAGCDVSILCHSTALYPLKLRVHPAPGMLAESQQRIDCQQRLQRGSHSISSLYPQIEVNIMNSGNEFGECVTHAYLLLLGKVILPTTRCAHLKIKGKRLTCHDYLWIGLVCHDLPWQGMCSTQHQKLGDWYCWWTLGHHCGQFWYWGLQLQYISSFLQFYLLLGEPPSRASLPSWNNLCITLISRLLKSALLCCSLGGGALSRPYPGEARNHQTTTTPWDYSELLCKGI